MQDFIFIMVYVYKDIQDMDKKMIDDMKNMFEMTARMEGHTQVKSVVVKGSADYENDPQLRQMARDGWDVYHENCFGQGFEMYTCVVYVRAQEQGLISSLAEGDYVKVLSNKPAFHLLSCYGGMDLTPEEVKPDEMICIVNYVIDGTCCYVTTVSPRPGSNFVACSDEVICRVDSETLTEEQRKVRLHEAYTAVNGFDSDTVPVAEDTYGKCVEVATRAIKVLFPEVEPKAVTVESQSGFSHLGQIGRLDFFLNGIAAVKGEERRAELAALYDEISEYVCERKFRNFYEVRAEVDGSGWMIPVSYDFRKAFVCRDINERTRFSRYLGGEYMDALHAVDHFMEECCKD